MPIASYIILVVVFLVTSSIGVVTGSNSLIAVPAMFQLGVEPRVAVATNMFGLVFMAVGGTLPFLRKGAIDIKRISPLLVITGISSAIGAALVGLITGEAMKAVVSVAMIAVSAFILLRRDSADADRKRAVSAWVTYVLTFVLGVYGGLYSGGYVTVLTATLVAFFGMTFTESVASTKLINVVSSSIATVIFMWQGLVDYTLGAVLGITMFVGGYIGGHYASRLDEAWLRRIFLAAVLVLAIKTIYDLTIY